MLLADFFVGRDILWQLRAATYPKAEGLVLGSEVKESPGSKGKRNYRPVIKYRFAADGRDVVTESRKSGLSFGNSFHSSRAVVGKYPPGSAITVSYNPAAPEESTYDPGLKPQHLHVAMFLTPFNTIGLFFLLPFLRRFGGRGAPRIVTTDDLRMTVDLPAFPPFLAALGTFTAAAFVGTFIVALSGAPTFPKLLSAWGILLALAAGAYRWQRTRITRGHYQLIVDAGSKKVSLPPIDDRTMRTELPFEQIDEIVLQRLPHTFTRKSRWGATVTTKGGPPQFELKLIGARIGYQTLSRSADETMLRSIGESLSQTFGWAFTEKSA